MARHEIPARTFTTCDACGASSEVYTFRHESVLILKAHGLDHYGCAVGDGTVSWDLCDRCYTDARKAVEAFVASREPRGEGER